MLKEFTIKNFTSFKDETLFSMEADTERVSEHPDHVVSINGNRLLKVVSMYGPNGGGKSNLLFALRLAKMVQSNKGLLDVYEFPFIFNDSEVIEETVFFVDEKYEIGYRFCILQTSIEDEEPDIGRMPNRSFNRQGFEIISEEVSYRKIGESEFLSLFSRNRLGVIESKCFKKKISSSEFRLAKGKSVVKYLYDTFANADGDLQEDLDVIKHLSVQINKITLLNGRGIIFYNSKSREQETVKLHEKELVSLLHQCDVNIKKIKVYDKRFYPIFFVRELTVNGEKIERELPLTMESEGTQKVFWFLLSILENLKDGKIFYCDDMNAYLHPKMFRAVIKLFQENQFGSQLIFNSHDIINMDNELFRRDEIWFAYRDEEYATQLVPLSNIVNYKGEQIRKDAKYYKQYLEGKYGADPFIQRGLNWNV